MNYVTTIGDKEYNVEVLDNRHVRIENHIMEVDFESISGQPVYSLLIDGKSYEAFVYPGEDEWQVLLQGQQYPVHVEDARERRLKAAAGGTLQGGGEFQLKAPMPGLVVAVPVQENQDIEKGQVLLVLESMKMQNELRSPRAGKVERIKIKPGESVEQRQVLLSIVQQAAKPKAGGMAQETEAKFYILHPDELKKRVQALGAQLIEPRVLERNLRFDTPAHDLQRARRVLRLRQDTRARITYKDTDSMETTALSRREVEVTVSDFDVARELLEALGYEVAFIYEKYRTTYKLEGMEIMLDELPYGHFVEIEGDGNALKSSAERLALAWDAVIPDSYSRLFENLRASRDLKLRDLTFDSIRGFQVSPADLGVRPADA